MNEIAVTDESTLPPLADACLRRVAVVAAIRRANTPVRLPITNATLPKPRHTHDMRDLNKNTVVLFLIVPVPSI